MRITKLELKNIGPFEDAVFEIPAAPGPGEVVLFEGPNGSGKTTIAEAIATFIVMSDYYDVYGMEERKAVTRRYSSNAVLEADHRAGGQVAARYLSRSRSAGGHLELEIDDGATHRSSHLHRFGDLLRSQSPHDFAIARLGTSLLEGQVEAAFAYRSHHPSPSMKVAGPKELDFDPLHGALTFDGDSHASDHFAQFLTNLEYDRVRAETYAREQPAAEEYTRAATSARDAIARIEHVLSRVLDRRVEVRFPFRQTAPQILFDGDEVPIEMLGEGMRATVSWLADLLVRLERITWADTARSPLDQDFWLILDEIDQGLHPQLQMRLFPALRELFPRARIYATTHSPFVVASLGDGVVFPIRPDAKTHRVSGTVTPKPLRPGQSLALVVEDIFETPSDFIDDATRKGLEQHRDSVDAIRRGAAIDWPTFQRVRTTLLGLNDEVATIVAMREVPARKLIETELAKLARAAR